MKLINVRSPYIISVNEVGQIETKIELRIWNFGGTKPTDPTYQFSKPIPSAAQRECVWNISNFAKDFIENKLESVIDVDLTEYNFCNLEVKTYYKLTDTFVLKDTLDFICLNGYTNFVGGANQFKDGSAFQNLSLINDIIIYDAKASQYYIQLYFPSADYSILRVNSLGTTTLVPEIGINNLYVGGFDSITITDNLEEVVSEFTIMKECETLLTPVICSFVNRHGAIQQLTFFKLRTDSIETTSTKYNRLPSSWTVSYTHLTLPTILLV